MADKEEHINITLYYQKNRSQKMDLRIPRNITVYRLIKELNQIFGKERESEKYQIKVVNKGFILDEEQKVKEYPITNGDMIEVLGE